MNAVTVGITFVTIGLALVIFAPRFAREPTVVWTARWRLVQVRKTRLGRQVTFMRSELFGVFAIAVGLSVLLSPAPAAQVTGGIAFATFALNFLFTMFFIVPARMWGMLTEDPEEPKAPTPS